MEEQKDREREVERGREGGKMREWERERGTMGRREFGERLMGGE